jgi:hypothetical protein
VEHRTVQMVFSQCHGGEERDTLGHQDSFSEVTELAG